MIEIVALSLIGLNIFQLVFWSYQHHRLVDKIMSGNYYNYQQAQGLTNTFESRGVRADVNPEMLEDLRGVKAIHPFM